MSILHGRLYPLSIPFKITFSHSEASRSACDSYILELTDGENRGFGELILREYVNDPTGVFASDEKISTRIKEILAAITEENTKIATVDNVHSAVMQKHWKPHDLPLLAAVETALLDLLCRQQDIDIYRLLDLAPKRNEITYGGVLPILPPSAMEKIFKTYKQMETPYMRIKLSGDYGYNARVLETARSIFGDGFDLRVDVNCGWNVETTLRHIELLSTHDVHLVEEPIGTDRKEMLNLVRHTRKRGITYVADESAVSFEDIETIIADKTFGMLNLRIAKNGGLLRTLELAKRAEQANLHYQLGCHVGETGILSVIGRIAASLMEEPRYVDGSFDDLLLSDNITAESYTFGHGGRASIIRGEHIGYTVTTEKLGTGMPLF